MRSAWTSTPGLLASTSTRQGPHRPRRRIERNIMNQPSLRHPPPRPRLVPPRAPGGVPASAARSRATSAWTIVGGNIRNDMADTMAGAGRAGRRVHARDGVARGRAHSTSASGRSREVLPWSSPASRGDRSNAGSRCRPRGSSRSRSPKRATTSTPDLHTSTPLYPELRRRSGEGKSLQHDLRSRREAILRRTPWRSNAEPVTLLNCDNLRSNGARFRSRHARLPGRAAGEHRAARRGSQIEHELPERHGRPHHAAPHCPMCARTREGRGRPRPTARRADERELHPVGDRGPLRRRPAGTGRTVGAEMVDSVHAHEEAKIRHPQRHPLAASPGPARLRGLAVHPRRHGRRRRSGSSGLRLRDARRCHSRASTHRRIPCPIDLAAYRDVVLDRFGNPFILLDNNQRVAMDGFSEAAGDDRAHAARLPRARGRLRWTATAMLPALFFEFLSPLARVATLACALRRTA